MLLISRNTYEFPLRHILLLLLLLLYLIGVYCLFVSFSVNQSIGYFGSGVSSKISRYVHWGKVTLGLLIMQDIARK